MEFLKELWSRVGLHDDVSLPVVALVASVAGVVMLLPKLWPKTRFWVTYIHELGHSATSIATGGGLRGMKIHKNSGGVAETYRKKGLIGWLSEQLTTYAGYPFPALVSLIMTVSTNVGFSSILLLALAVISTVAILFMRNLRGLGLALLIAGISGLAFWFTPPEFHAALMLLLAGVLIAGGVRSVFELQQKHREGDIEDSDVAALTRGFKPLEIIVFTSYYLIYLVSAAASLYFAWVLV